MNTQNSNSLQHSLEGNSDLVPPALTEAIQQSIQPVMVKGYRRGETFLAIGSQHGNRLMLQINVHASEIPTLLRTRSVREDSNDPTSGKNRPVNDKHVESIKKYIIERASSGNKWILGTITASVDPSQIEYQKIWGDLYVAFVQNNAYLEITDGQHRKRAITELIESDKDNERDLVSQETFPVTLVLEGELSQCQIDFCDMAQTYPIAKSLLVAYGGFGRDGIAKEVVELVDLFRNKTQKIKSTPGSRTGYIYTINYVAKLVSAAFSGNSNNKLPQYSTRQEVDEHAELLADTLNLFFLECPITSNLSQKDKLSYQEVEGFRDSSILGLSVGLEVLGILLHETLDKVSNSFDTEMVESLAHEIDWSKTAKCWMGNIIFEDPKRGLKISAGKSAIQAAVNSCHQVLGWNGE